jgi:hypothetical protein
MNTIHSFDPRDPRFNLQLEPGAGIRFDAVDGAGRVPTAGGLYAVVHWHERLITIGEGRSLRARFSERRNWTRAMHAGTAPESQLRRLNLANPFPIVVAAAQYGLDGWEFFVLSSDPSFQHRRPDGCAERQHAERNLFRYVANSAARLRLRPCNEQRSWRTCRECPTARAA